MLVILLMLSIMLLLFQYKPVQTWAAKKATGYLSEKLNTKVDIKSLYIKTIFIGCYRRFLRTRQTKRHAAEYAKTTVDINGFSLFSSIKDRHLDLRLVQLDNGSVYLKKQKDGTSNLKFLIDYFKLCRYDQNQGTRQTLEDRI